MNTPFRRVALALLILIAGFVGIWAEAFPVAFYTSFPGFGLHWSSADGPYNEHLVRDVGSFYLGLGVATAVALFSRSALRGRLVGIAWTVFGVLHFGYHVLHLEGSTLDRVGNIVSLGVSLALGVILTLPSRATRHQLITGTEATR
jgi:hypothetical protein